MDVHESVVFGPPSPGIFAGVGYANLDASIDMAMSLERKARQPVSLGTGLRTLARLHPLYTDHDSRVRVSSSDVGRRR